MTEFKSRNYFDNNSIHTYLLIINNRQQPNQLLVDFKNYFIKFVFITVLT